MRRIGGPILVNTNPNEFAHRRQVIMALAALATVFAFGTAGFSWIEGWPTWKSFYFTLITITTVGYGDEGISETGAKFAGLLLVFGLAITSYAFAILVQFMVTSPFAWRRRMQSKIDKLEGHVIVCGFGRMGQSICEELEQAGRRFVIVEPEAERVKEALELGYLLVQGSCTEDEILLAAGLERATHIVVMTPSDDQNIVAALSARGLAPAIEIIARSACPSDTRKLERAGADKVVSPFRSGGMAVATMITRPRVAELLSEMDGSTDIVLAEISIAEQSSIAGTTLSEYGRDVAREVCFVAIDRPGEERRISPPGSTEIMPEDTIIVAGDPEQIATMREHGRATSGDRVLQPGR